VTGDPISVLVLGASYGLAVGVRAAIAGHHVDFVCRPDELESIREGRFQVSVAARDADVTLELGVGDCQKAPGALGPSEVIADRYQIAILAMQEPQYTDPELATLIQRLAACRIPCVSVMNMPLPIYISQSLGVPISAELAGVWQDPELWGAFDPTRFTAASPDPQAIRRPHEHLLAVDVTLPTNLKVAPFSDPAGQAILQRLAQEMDGATVVRDANRLTPRLRLIAHESTYVPMAKWPMLLTGNFRCLREGAPVSIAEAVLEDIDSSKSVYTWVDELCRELIPAAQRAGDVPFVSFERYCAAAGSLVYPSSLARGLASGATRVERVDRLIQLLGRAAGKRHHMVDDIVQEVDRRLAKNLAAGGKGK
jgi:hypothetical protein